MHFPILSTLAGVWFSRRVRHGSGCPWVNSLPARLLWLAWLAVLPVVAADDKVLVFTKTAGFRHACIPAGIQMVQELGAANGFAVDATEDATAFTPANLAQYKAVVWLCTTGDALNGEQEAAFEGFIRAGGGYVGIHAASDTEQGWAWYGQLVGAYFAWHPSVQPAKVIVADRFHPSTAMLPERWVRTDEWYSFNTNPRGRVHVLMTLDQASYEGGGMGHDHPTAWCHEFDGGRAWYTGGGHTTESYGEPLFRAHVLGGIEWAARRKAGDGNATVDAKYEKVTLASSLDQPMELAAAPDGRVLFIERTGRIKVWHPGTALTTVAGELPVFSSFEDGLLGLALDPGFATNHWVYLMYSPTNAARQNVSRFTMTGNALDLASERILLEIPVQRDQCCHSGGSLAFGPGGLLYIATGDNTNPFESAGFAPIDERPGRAAWDAQKSSANANDLRGKVLRILPQPDGSYTIPAGNLFPPGMPATRPEIFAMGCRNPFRISVDQATGTLYWGDVGPDAAATNASRGPAGFDEINRAAVAGNFGWPYFVGSNFAYRDFDFATSNSSGLFLPSAVSNASPNNTGTTTLPAAQPAWIWYAYTSVAPFPEFSNGVNRTALAGPVFAAQRYADSGRRLPDYFDRTLFIYDWSRSRMHEVKLDAAGEILKINPFLPSLPLDRPIDMDVGPDGAIYLLEWGTNLTGQSSGRLARIDYTGGNLAPIPAITATPANGPLPLTVQFSGAGSFDPEGGPLTFAWSFFGDGVTNSTAPNPSFTFTNAGNYTTQLRVYDVAGVAGIASVEIAAGNSTPVVSLSHPPSGAIYEWGETIAWVGSASDAEDGSIAGNASACVRFVLEPFLGHDSHSHNLGRQTGCAGSFVAPLNSDSPEDDLYLLFNASYRDNGAPGVNPVTGSTLVRLNPKFRQAEHHSRSNGITLAATTDPLGGGLDVVATNSGAWISFDPLNLVNITNLTLRVAVSNNRWSLELRRGSTNGELLLSEPLSGSGSGVFTSVTLPVQPSTISAEHFLIFRRTGGTPESLRLNWLQFNGPGISTPVMRITAQPQGANVLLHWTDAGAQLESTDTFGGPWQPVVPSPASPLLLTPSNSSRFFRLRKP